jgi:hypothetical protein
MKQNDAYINDISEIKYQIKIYDALIYNAVTEEEKNIWKDRQQIWENRLKKVENGT